MDDCKICRLKFRTEIKGDTIIIILYEVKTKKELGYMRFENKPSKIELEYVVSYEQGKGYGSKLIRVIKAIGKTHGKPVYLYAVPFTESFFIKHGFMKLEEIYDGELIRMVWDVWKDTKSI